MNFSFRRFSLAAAFLFLATKSSAQIVLPATWVGGNESWIEPGSWFPEPLDVNNFFLLWPDEALSENYFVVTVPSGSPSVDTPLTITTLIVNGGAGVDISGIGQLSLEVFGVTGSAAENNGLISVDGSGVLKALTLTGGGTVAISDSAQVNGLVLNESDHTIRGEGTVNQLSGLDVLVNQGTLLADSSGDTLRIAGIGLVNSGEARAINTGRLKIETPLFTNDELVEANGGDVELDVSTFDNNDTVRALGGGSVLYKSITANSTSGLAEALADSRIRIETSILKGGTFRTAGSGLIHFDSGESRLTNSSVLEGSILIDSGKLEIRDASVNATLATLTSTGPNVTVRNSTLHSGKYTGGGTFTIASPSVLNGTATAATIDAATFSISGNGGNPGNLLTLQGETRLENGGQIRVAAAADLTAATLRIDGPVLLFGNGGSVLFTDPGHNSGNHITPFNSGVLTISTNISIVSPSLAIGYITAPLINHGTITAPGGFIEIGNEQMSNDGLITASLGGDILIWRPDHTTVDNSGGTIRAETNSTISLSGVLTQIPGFTTIRAGTLDGGGTIINRSRTTLDGATEGPITIRDVTLRTPGNSQLGAIGTINFDEGTMQFVDANDGVGKIDASLMVNGNVLFDGIGTMDFSFTGFSPYNNLMMGTESALLTLGEGITAIADNTNDVGTFTVNTINHGHIHATNGGLVQFENVATTNSGVIESSTGGRIQLGRINQPTLIANEDGTLRANAGSTTTLSGIHSQIPGVTTVQGGVMEGLGTFQNISRVVLNGESAGPITLRDAMFVTPGNTRTELYGSLVFDDGIFRLMDANNLTGSIDASLHVHGNATLAGSGLIDFSFAGGAPYNNSIEGAASALLTIEGGITAIADNTNDVGTFTVNTINHGHIHATNGGLVKFENVATTNFGVIESSTSGRIQLGRINQPTLIVNEDGTLRANAGSTTTLSGIHSQIPGVTTVRGGVFEGTGTFLNYSRVILDGNSAGAITLRDATFLTPGNTRTELYGSLVFDNGIFRMVDANNLTGSIDASLYVHGHATLDGTGTIDFSSAGNASYNNSIEGPASSLLTIAAGITAVADNLNDVGSFTVNTINHGHVHAVNGGIIQFLNVGTTNTGIIESSEGGQVHLGRINQPTLIHNSTGILRANTNSTVTLSGVHNQAPGVTTLRGGTLDGGGSFHNGPYAILDGASTGPMTLRNATFKISHQNELHLFGTLTLDNGTIALQDNTFGTGTAYLRVDDHATINGTGTIRFLPNNSGGQPETVIETPGGSLTLGSGVTVLSQTNGGGLLIGNYNNFGTINAQGGNISIQATVLTNRGVIRASSPGSISIGRNQYSLTDNVGGLFSAGAGSMINLSASSGATVTRGGTLEGPGQYRGGYTLLDSLEANPVTLRNTTYNIFADSQLHLLGTLLLDNAIINIQDNGTPFKAAFLRTDNHVSLTGTGSILLSPSPNGGIAENFVETPAGSLSVGSNITIFASTNGGGTISGNYRNDGIIHVQKSLLNIFPNAFTNRGTIRVSDGGTLNLNGSAAIHNVGGLIETDTNSTLTCTSMHILGGTLAGGTIGNANFLLLDGSQSPLTLRSATVTGGHNTDTSFLGTIELDDATLNPRHIVTGLGRNASIFKALNPVSLTGVGRVLFGPLTGPNANILSFANNGSWTLGPQVDLILNADGVGALSAPLTAHGLVRADANLGLFGPLTIAPDGTLGGTGTFSIGAGGSILNHGTINPGASPGKTTIAGSLANSPSATLLIEINGTTAITQHDVLQVSGQLLLAGKLGVSFPTGFVPQPTDSFTIINAGSFAGAFSNVSGGRVTYGNHSFAVIQTGNSISLTGYAPAVDPFQPWIDSFTSLTNSADKTTMADADNDGRLNVVEFVMGTSPVNIDNSTASISGNNAIFTFTRSKEALAAGYGIYAIYSEHIEPADWVPVPLGMLSVTDFGLLESVVATIPMPPSGSLFVTLKISFPPYP